MFLVLTGSYADDKQSLRSIRQSIIEHEKKLVDQKYQRINIIADLQKQETTIAQLIASVEQSQQLLSTLSNDIADLNIQISHLENKQLLQKKILAKQLDGAFRLGKTSGIELVFSGQQSERNERIIAYYGYINADRQRRINTLKQIQTELSEKNTQIEQKYQTQELLKLEQSKQKDSLLTNQKMRQKSIDVLEQSIELNQQKLNVLKENENALKVVIAKAEKESKKIAEAESKQAARIQEKKSSYNYSPTKNERALMARVSGIGKPNHQLNWPVLGKILHQFGEPQHGELYWKALVIDAKEGTKVKAIADGRVILASWLQGYGFIVVLEHGKGDMTLYGYNQRILVSVGDKIEQGQNIALVGNTGGQARSSLYFEVRRDGMALDPKAWLKI